MPSVADRFFAGMAAGQAAKAAREDERRNRRREEQEDEDRAVEKELLQHRMRELKISERLRAREASRQNFDFLEGTPADNIPFEASEPDNAPLPGGMPGPGSVPRPVFQFRNMSMPGVPELGVPGVAARPQTMEQQLAALFTQKSIEAATKPWEANIAPGGKFVRGTGDQVTHEIEGGPRPLVPFVERDAKGVETTTWITEEDRARRTAVKQPLPRRTPTSATAATGDDINDIVEGIIRGEQSANLTGYRGADRLKIDAALRKAGFNSRQAIADENALRTHFAGLNSQGRQDVRIAADAAEAAIEALEGLSNEWAAGGFGTWNSARIELAKRGGLGEAQKKLALDLEAAISDTRDAIAVLKSGGSGATNRSLDDAEKALSADFSSEKMASVLARIKSSLRYRINAIRTLDAILPSETDTQDDLLNDLLRNDPNATDVNP